MDRRQRRAAGAHNPTSRTSSFHLISMGDEPSSRARQPNYRAAASPHQNRQLAARRARPRSLLLLHTCIRRSGPTKHAADAPHHGANAAPRRCSTDVWSTEGAETQAPPRHSSTRRDYAPRRRPS